MWTVNDQVTRCVSVNVSDAPALRTELRRLATLSPRVVSINLSDNEYLQIGIGGISAFVEHVIENPWKAAVALSRYGAVNSLPDFVSFICGGQDTEVPSYMLMSALEAIDLVVEFATLGTSPPGQEWELV